LHFLSSAFLKDSERKRRLEFKKSQAALRNRETNISCLASASSTHLFTITYLMGVALSSDLFYAHLIGLYSSKICWKIGKQIDYMNIVKFNIKGVKINAMWIYIANNSIDHRSGSYENSEVTQDYLKRRLAPRVGNLASET